MPIIGKDIWPSGDFKERTSEIRGRLTTTHLPVVLRRNGSLQNFVKPELRHSSEHRKLSS
jgi:hypothetical protein